MVGDLEHHLGLLPRCGRRLVAFLGGTVGNLLPAERERFLTDLDVDAFADRAVWVEPQAWIEMRLASLRAQTVHLRALHLIVAFGAGEQLWTEVSATFTEPRVRAELAAAGLDVLRWWTDPDGEFGVSLSVRG